MTMQTLILKFHSSFSICLAVFLMSAGTLGGCTERNSQNRRASHVAKAEVRDDGKTILFPEGSPGLAQIAASEAKKGSALVSVMAPSRVVASISFSMTSKDRLVLFDSPDVQTLYSLYRQSRANVRLSSDNLGRVKQMFDNQGATVRDLNQAENDAANARSSMAEMEGRLRAIGFDPVELESDSSNKTWLICDVPENELHEVQKGEDVDVYFSSFPDKKYIGRADAIGDIIDPVTRTVKVRVTLPNPKGRFLPGMYARVDFGDPVDGVILLPLSAVVTVNSQDYVFVEVAPREYQRREVTIVSSNAKEVIVLKGLESGARVVTSGAMLLKGLSFGF
jgi:cobalt-zinc-cadmium efflux system membrane fusion protein